MTTPGFPETACSEGRSAPPPQDHVLRNQSVGRTIYVQATTACLSAIVLMQIVNVYLCRNDRESVFASSLWSNRLILVGIGVELLLILVIDYTPWGNQLFGTAPLGLDEWLFVIPFAVGMLILEEVRKFIARRFIGRPHR